VLNMKVAPLSSTLSPGLASAPATARAPALASGAQPWRAPPALRPGDRIAVVAPAGPVPPTRYAAGAVHLEGRYELLTAPGLFHKTGYLAGDDGRRLADLRWALSDPSVRAVCCARGGYGTLRYLPQLLALPSAELRPVPLVGFSDITVLHAWAATARLRTIHGPVVTQLGELTAADAAALWTLLEDPAPPPPLEELLLLAARAPVQGRLLGGNLEVLSRLCGTPLGQALLPGEPVVLLLEEVTEAPYRIDRALTQLLLSGALGQVCAVVVGDLVRCDGPADGSHPSALDVIAERLHSLGVPILAGAPIGHGARNRAVPLGALVECNPQRRSPEFLEGAVS
jgi:muramoyltetrapeptide carboxypeptidase